MNIQGISKLEFYKASLVDFPFLKQNSSVDISKHTNAIPEQVNFIPGSCSMKTTEKEVKQGFQTDISIPLVIAGNSSEVISKLNYYKIIPHIIVVTDNMNVKYVIGHNKGPLPKLLYYLKNDGDGKGGRSISVSIKLSTPHFPIYSQ